MHPVTAYGYDDLDRTLEVKHDYYGGGGTWPVTNLSISNPDVSYTYWGSTSQVYTVTDTNIDGTSQVSTYEYDPQGRITKYTPAVPDNYGSITYTWNNLGQKTSMTIPLGKDSKAKQITYNYDSTGKQSGMTFSVVNSTGTSSTSLDSTSSSSQTRFFWDDNQNRVKLINKAGGVYYFVYDPTAGIPAVVYEQGPSGGSRYLNIREPDGGLISREKYDGATGMSIGCWTYHFRCFGKLVPETAGRIA